jgi:hypothetical protein
MRLRRAGATPAPPRPRFNPNGAARPYQSSSPTDGDAVRLLALLLVLSCVSGHPAAATTPHATLTPFASEQELDALLERWRRLEQRSRREAAESAPAATGSAGNGVAFDMMAAAPAAPAAKAAESITKRAERRRRRGRHRQACR